MEIAQACVAELEARLADGKPADDFAYLRSAGRLLFVQLEDTRRNLRCKIAGLVEQLFMHFLHQRRQLSRLIAL
eukprot:1118102-Pleurochrysis_carterae.AAC.1